MPQRLHPLLLTAGLGSGVVGTGLLYNGATTGHLTDLLIGAPLFAFGLWMVGWPFVLSTTLLSNSRRRDAERRRRERRAEG